MYNLTIPVATDAIVPYPSSASTTCLLTHFNGFNGLIRVIELGKFQQLSIKEPEEVKSEFECIFNILPKLLEVGNKTDNVWVDIYRPIVLDQYRRVVRIKLTAMDERVKKKRAKLRTQTVDALFVGLYKLITMFEEVT